MVGAPGLAMCPWTGRPLINKQGGGSTPLPNQEEKRKENKETVTTTKERGELRLRFSGARI